jgi:hypothetical protein
VPTVARRLPLVAAALAALVGLALLVLGLWAAIGLGPAGRAGFSTTRQTPGIELVGSSVLARVDAPVEVTVTRADGGPVWLGLAHDADARSALGSSPHLSVDRVHYPSGAVDVSTTGAGASRAAQLQGGDVWQHTSTGTGTARLVVSPDAAPLSVVATSANAAALGRVRTTLAWQHRTWFFEALAAAALGLTIAALALGYLRHARSRRAPQQPTGATGATGTARSIQSSRSTRSTQSTRSTPGTGSARTPSGPQVGTSVPPQASGTGQVGRE